MVCFWEYLDLSISQTKEKNPQKLKGNVERGRGVALEKLLENMCQDSDAGNWQKAFNWGGREKGMCGEMGRRDREHYGC